MCQLWLLISYLAEIHFLQTANIDSFFRKKYESALILISYLHEIHLLQSLIHFNIIGRSMCKLFAHNLLT